jgi:acetylglutamate kinase
MLFDADTPMNQSHRAYMDDTPDASEGPQPEAASNRGPIELGTIVIKIGGSTLGGRDTTIRDVVDLQRQGFRPILVHGGGKVISEWMERQGVRPRFVRGLRVTDSASLDIVVAVLTGVVNKAIVASLEARGGKAIGLSGVDGGILHASLLDPGLGLVGKISRVDKTPIEAVSNAGFIPVIAPVAIRESNEGGDAGALLNVNADTAAGEIASALAARRLVLLTDVEGVLDTSRRLIPRLTRRQAADLTKSRVVDGGMIPKLEACLAAIEAIGAAHIVDGRKPGVLMGVLSGESVGTRVG